MQCELPVNVSSILVAINRNAPYAHLRAGSEHSDGDLSPWRIAIIAALVMIFVII